MCFILLWRLHDSSRTKIVKNVHFRKVFTDILENMFRARVSFSKPIFWLSWEIKNDAASSKSMFQTCFENSVTVISTFALTIIIWTTLYTKQKVIQKDATVSISVRTNCKLLSVCVIDCEIRCSHVKLDSGTLSRENLHCDYDWPDASTWLTCLMYILESHWGLNVMNRNKLLCKSSSGQLHHFNIKYSAQQPQNHQGLFETTTFARCKHPKMWQRFEEVVDDSQSFTNVLTHFVVLSSLCQKHMIKISVLRVDMHSSFCCST